MYVHRLTDKHSVYAHKATADISLMGVRIPPSIYSDHHHHLSGALKASFTLLAEPRRGWREGVEGKADTGVVFQKKRKILVRIGHFFSLRVQMHTYPLAVALYLLRVALVQFSALRM